MEISSIPYKVHKCSKCSGDTGYYCVSCPCDLCPQCKENHAKDLNTIDHIVETHRIKFNFIPSEEICLRHPSKVLRKYCEPCELPVCFYCRKHRNHRQIDVTTAYEKKRQQHRETIYTLRNEAFLYRPVILTQIKADFKTCHTEFSLNKSQMLTTAQKLKDFIDNVLYDLLSNVFCDFNFKHRCLKQEIEMSRHIGSLQRYVYKYEQPAFTFSALQFLSSIKKALPQKHLKLHTSQLSMTESLNTEDVMESLSAIRITERGKRHIKYQCLLKLMSAPEFHQYVKSDGGSCHISCVPSDRVWVSDIYSNISLIDTTLNCMNYYDEFLCDRIDYCGSHTLDSERNLIFIDMNSNVSKLSKDMKTTAIFLERTDTTWESLCVYCSPSTGDLLLGMYTFTREGEKKGKITRYNQSGQLIQTILYDNTKLDLYRFPSYIAENNNRDVVVSDSLLNAVVVTDRGGRHRFSYTGHLPGSRLDPHGICTDALSHILVCDATTNTVQMLDRNGQFLSHLLIRPSGIFKPCSLSYDVNTHRLWVGSFNNNKVVVYRYITRQDALTDLNKETSEALESLSEIPTIEREKPQRRNQCLLKLKSPPKLLHSLTVTGVDSCFHISCVTSDQRRVQQSECSQSRAKICVAGIGNFGDRSLALLNTPLVWVSDDRNNLILINTTGVRLYRLKDLYRDLDGGRCGFHTVNSENELIYLDYAKNINKLSKDLKITTTFIKKAWAAQCVYCSPSTGDLFVGMCTYDDFGGVVPIKGKVTRYNQSGQLTQTIKYDNTKLELYKKPSYITENNNGDVVVSDYEAVVVTERGGRHRFSYTGHPSGSELEPHGICTDTLSHILVCDGIAKTVHMIDKYGQFLLHLLTKSQEIHGDPCGLCYDANTHRLFVGSEDSNKVCVYRYIDVQKF